MSHAATHVSDASQLENRTWFSSGMALVWAIAVAKLIFHVYFNNRYGYFRDEFDYIACGDHLAWGYVDQPPLIPFLIHISRALLGDSLRSIRFIPALASSLLVVQTALIAREFGGRRFALLLSAVTVVIAPQYLSNGSLLTTNCLEPNVWMGCAYFAILSIKRNDSRYWLWFGVIAGLGLEEKYTIALFGLGIVVGLLLTEHRRFLLDKWFWLAGVAAFLIFLPNVIWNIHYHWPFLQLMHNIRADGRDVVLGPVQYFIQQAILVHPLAAPVWIAGLIALFCSARLKPYRLLGWSYLVCYAVLFALHGKNYYLAPAYPMLLAAGSVVIDFGFNRPAYAWLKPAIAILLLAGGAHLAPVTVPILSPDHFLAYTKRLPFKLPVMEHQHERAALPQWYADQFGWQEIVDETALAWNQIPQAERAGCAILAQDYGQAGAIDFLGRPYGLPPALSGHQTYFLWGPRGYSGQCMIVLGESKQALERYFDSVQFVGISPDNPYALETEIGVDICRGPKFGTLAQLWPALKKWR
ncbi:MAG TPA: glycosyltransferase family 39 protein [Candidatus Acidoferrales bacterium]